MLPLNSCRPGSELCMRGWGDMHKGEAADAWPCRYPRLRAAGWETLNMWDVCRRLRVQHAPQLWLRTQILGSNAPWT